MADNRESLAGELAKKKDRKNFPAFYEKSMAAAKQKLRESVKEDSFIIQAANNIGDLTKVCNTLVKRMREWYALYNPEFERSVTDNERFAELIAKGKDQKDEGSMGGSLEKKDLDAIRLLADEINSLYKLRSRQEEYIGSIMKRLCPSMTAITGPLIGAQLIGKAGSFKRLMEMPASTVQLLGAETALFRHMRNKNARPPKHGLIVQHPLIAQAKKKDKGKIARALADKIGIALKVDYFKGEFIGDELMKKLEQMAR